MIAVGTHLVLKPTTNRWGFLDGRVEAPHYGWVDEKRWADIQAYQAPLPDGKDDHQLKLAMIDRNFDAIMRTKTGEQIRAQMMIPGKATTIWEMNIATPDRTDYMRTYALLGEEHLVRWSWVDIHVRLPILKLRAAYHNRSVRDHT